MVTYKHLPVLLIKFKHYPVVGCVSFFKCIATKSKLHSLTWITLSHTQLGLQELQLFKNSLVCTLLAHPVDVQGHNTNATVYRCT